MEDILLLHFLEAYMRFFNTGKAVTRSDEVNEGTIPTPRFSRDSSTWNPPSHAQEFTLKIKSVDHHRLQISDLHFHTFLTPSTFSD